MQIKPLNDMWVVVDNRDFPRLSTISKSAENTKSLLCKNEEWPDYEECGYRCVRVDVSFTVKE